MRGGSSGSGGWLLRGGHGLLLAVALLFVMLAVYLPHMLTFAPGDDAATGAFVEEAPWWEPWQRLGAAYGGWVQGEWDDYPYPLHLDDQVHWTRMAALQRAETLLFPLPYAGDPYEVREAGTVAPQSLRGLVHESGFWLAFAQFQDMTGIPWLHFMRFAPAAMAAVTASLVWAALRPAPWAPLAAAFVGLVPTTVRFLGIGFFVPIGFGLAWVAAALVLAPHAYRDPRFMILTLALGAWAFFIHLIAGFAFVLLLLGATWPLWRENRARTLFLAAGVALPFLAFYEMFSADFQTEIDRVGWLPLDFTVFDQVGIPFLVLWALGTTMVLTEPPRGRARVPAIAAALGSLVALAFIVVNVSFRLQRYALYDRWHQVFALLAVIPVAYTIYLGWRALRWLGVKGHAAWRARGGRSLGERHARWALPTAGILVVTAGFVGVAGPGVAAHLDEPYYRTMDDEMWAAFQAAETLGSEYRVYLTHPWRAHLYNAMTGKYPYTHMDPGAPPPRGEDFVAYRGGRFADELWLVQRDITLVLDPVAPRGPHWSTIAPGVHVLDRDLALALQEARTPR